MSKAKKDLQTVTPDRQRVEKHIAGLKILPLGAQMDA
jgi:hypothetical protein